MVDFYLLFLEQDVGLLLQLVPRVCSFGFSAVLVSIPAYEQMHRSLKLVQDGATLVGWLFLAAAVIACVICSFSLALSVYGKVTETSWEQGVLCALGVGR